MANIFTQSDLIDMNIQSAYLFQCGDEGYIITAIHNGYEETSFKYNFHARNFTKSDVNVRMYDIFSLNTSNHILYSAASNQSIMRRILNIANGTETHKAKMPPVPKPQSIGGRNAKQPFIKSLAVVNNNLHFIANWMDDNFHYFWNDDNKTYTQICKFSVAVPFETNNCSLIYLPSSNLLLYMG
eukprot:266629_1